MNLLPGSGLSAVELVGIRARALVSVMSGMEVTKELSSAGIAYADLPHLPRSRRATHADPLAACGVDLL